MASSGPYPTPGDPANRDNFNVFPGPPLRAKGHWLRADADQLCKYVHCSDTDHLAGGSWPKIKGETWKMSVEKDDFGLAPVHCRSWGWEARASPATEVESEDWPGPGPVLVQTLSEPSSGRSPAAFNSPCTWGGPSSRLKSMPVAHLGTFALLESANSVIKASYFPWLHFHTHTCNFKTSS